MEVIQKIKIDLLKPGVKPVVSAMQSDQSSRAIEIKLLANGVAWPIPAGASFSVAYEKPDGTMGLYDTLPDGSSAASVDGNVVSIWLAPQMLTAPGYVESSVVISSGEQTISTFPIIVNVIHNPAAGAVGSEDYFYSSVIGNLDDLKTTDKSSVVAAINEIFSTGGSSDSGQNGNGLTDMEKTLILSLFQNAVFTSDVSAILAQLETLWSNSEDGGGDGGTDTPTFYIVTNKLTNVSNSNHVASVESGDSYTATLTAEDGYDIESVTVTMGGSDITETAYAGGIVNIASVTGNVVITAIAKSLVDITQDGGTLIIVTVPNVTQDSGTLIIS